MSELRFPFGVEGYFTPREGEALFALAKSIPVERSIVELGAYKGRSTIVLAQSGRFVVSVDSFEGEPGLPGAKADHQAGTYHDEFEDNLERFGVRHWVHSVKGSTHSLSVAQNVAANWGPIGLVFIDADHAYEAVAADVATWMPHLAGGGILAFHDGHFDGPKQLIRELQDAGWRVIGHEGSLRALQLEEVPQEVLRGRTDQITASAL
jgi:predicted O-methyltransferase YrrM